MTDTGPVGLDENFAESEATAEDNYAFIAAIHNLVSTKRAAGKSDLLLAAACHSVRESDKTLGEVVTIVNQVWPGARTDPDSVLLALSLGEELGLLVQKSGLDETTLWSLTPRGVDDVDRQSGWVQELRSRTRDQLIARATEGLEVTVSSETADLWLERLLHALIAGIQSSQDAYFGRVEQLAGNRLVPKSIDQKRVFASLEDDRVSPATVDFLKAAALAAFDPLEPFGNEIVSLITTGCVLHSFVAGRDAADTITRLGDPAGQRALIDTPVLVDLVGPQRVRVPARFLLTTAVAAGWEVIVCEHSLDELIGLFEREIPSVKRSFTKAHERDVKQEWYASLVDNQLTTYCVEVLKDGTFSSLDEMVESAQNIRDSLRELGVDVRPHGNESDARYVERAKTALEVELETRGTPRSANAIERDANSMATVWRRRRKQVGTQWPGGWIITSDRHIAPAYKRVHGQDRVPLTLSMARWGTLLSATVPPAEVVELAEAAATQLVEEAMWLLPSRFPSEVALSLAKQLSPEKGGSELDMRYAQLTLDHSLDQGGVSRSAASLASDVLAARTKRTSMIQAEGMAQAAAKVAEAQREAESARAIAREQATFAEQARRGEVAKENELDQIRRDLTWERERGRRILWAAGLVIVAIGALVVSVSTNQPIWLSATICLVLVAVLVGGFRWISSQKSRLWPLLFVACIEVATVAVLAADLSGLAGFTLGT